MWEYDTQFSMVIQRTPQVKSFRFPIGPDRAPYQAGQYFFVRLRIGDHEAVHHFSFSSSPTEPDHIEFTKRITDHEYSQALDSVQPGAPANLTGPMGNFVLPQSRRKLAFLSGGIGITPMRSMLRYVADRGEDLDIVLFYSNTSELEIVYRDELDSLAKTLPHLRVIHVLSGPQVPPDWSGRRGLIKSDLVAEVSPDYAERLFYISGPPRMVMSLEDQLKELGVPANQLKRDSFTGYD